MQAFTQLNFLPSTDLKWKTGKKVSAIPCPYLADVTSLDRLARNIEFKDYILRNIDSDYLVTSMLSNSDKDELLVSNTEFSQIFQCYSKENQESGVIGDSKSDFVNVLESFSTLGLNISRIDSASIFRNDMLKSANIKMNPIFKSFQKRLAFLKCVDSIILYERSLANDLRRSRPYSGTFLNSTNQSQAHYFSMLLSFSENSLKAFCQIADIVSSDSLHIRTLLPSLECLSKSFAELSENSLFHSWSPRPCPPMTSILLDKATAKASGGVPTDAIDGQKLTSWTISSSKGEWSVNLESISNVSGIRISWSAIGSNNQGTPNVIGAPKKLTIRLTYKVSANEKETYEKEFIFEPETEHVRQNSWSHIYLLNVSNVISVKLLFLKYSMSNQSSIRMYNFEVLKMNNESVWNDVLESMTSIQLQLFPLINVPAISDSVIVTILSIIRTSGSLGLLLQFIKFCKIQKISSCLIRKQSKSILDYVVALNSHIAKQKQRTLFGTNDTIEEVIQDAIFDDSSIHNAQCEEEGKVVVSLSAGESYALGSVQMMDGIWIWEIALLADSLSDESACLGVGKNPISDTNYESSPDMWTIRCYSGETFHTCKLTGRNVFPNIHEGDVCRFTFEVEKMTVSLCVNEVDRGVIFSNVPPGISPLAYFYSGKNKKIKLLSMKHVIKQPSDGLKVVDLSLAGSLSTISDIESSDESISSLLLNRVAALCDARIAYFEYREREKRAKFTKLEYSYCIEASVEVLRLILDLLMYYKDLYSKFLNDVSCHCHDDKSRDTETSDNGLTKSTNSLMDNEDITSISNDIISLLSILKAQFYVIKNSNVDLQELGFPYTLSKDTKNINFLPSNGLTVVQSTKDVLLYFMRSNSNGEIKSLAISSFALGSLLFLPNMEDKLLVFGETLSHIDQLKINVENVSTAEVLLLNLMLKDLSSCSSALQIISLYLNTNGIDVMWNDKICSKLYSILAYIESYTILTSDSEEKRKINIDKSLIIGMFSQLQQQLWYNLGLSSTSTSLECNFPKLEMLLLNHVNGVCFVCTSIIMALENRMKSNLITLNSTIDQLIRDSSISQLVFPLIHLICFCINNCRIIPAMLSKLTLVYSKVTELINNLNYYQRIQAIFYHSIPRQPTKCSAVSSGAKGWKPVNCVFEDSDTAFSIKDNGTLFTSLHSSNTCAVCSYVFPATAKGAWEFKLEQDSLNDECSVFGAARPNFTSRCYNSSPDLWMRRSYNGSLYNNGTNLQQTVDKIHPGDVIRLEFDGKLGTLSSSVNGSPLEVLFNGIHEPIIPSCGSYRSGIHIRLLKVEIYQDKFNGDEKYDIETNLDSIDWIVDDKKNENCDPKVIRVSKDYKFVSSKLSSEDLASNKIVWVSNRINTGVLNGIHDFAFELIEIKPKETASSTSRDCIVFGVCMDIDPLTDLNGDHVAGKFGRYRLKSYKSDSNCLNSYNSSVINSLNNIFEDNESQPLTAANGVETDKVYCDKNEICGCAVAWHSNGSLWVNGEEKHSSFGMKFLPLKPLSVVVLRIDCEEKTISFFVNGVLVGVAFGPIESNPAVVYTFNCSRNIEESLTSAKKSTIICEGALYPCISLSSNTQSVRIAPAGTYGTLVLPLPVYLQKTLASVCGLLSAALVAGHSMSKQEIEVSPWLQSPLFIGGLEDLKSSSFINDLDDVTCKFDSWNQNVEENRVSFNSFFSQLASKLSFDSIDTIVLPKPASPRSSSLNTTNSHFSTSNNLSTAVLSNIHESSDPRVFLSSLAQSSSTSITDNSVTTDSLQARVAIFLEWLESIQPDMTGIRIMWERKGLYSFPICERPYIACLLKHSGLFSEAMAVIDCVQRGIETPKPSPDMISLCSRIKQLRQFLRMKRQEINAKSTTKTLIKDSRKENVIPSVLSTVEHTSSDIQPLFAADILLPLSTATESLCELSSSTITTAASNPIPSSSIVAEVGSETLDFFSSNIIWRVQRQSTVSPHDDDDTYDCSVLSVGLDMEEEYVYIKFTTKYDPGSDGRDVLPEESVLEVNGDKFSNAQVQYTHDDRSSTRSLESEDEVSIEGVLKFDIGSDFTIAEIISANITFTFSPANYQSVKIYLPNDIPSSPNRISDGFINNFENKDRSSEVLSNEVCNLKAISSFDEVCNVIANRANLLLKMAKASMNDDTSTAQMSRNFLISIMDRYTNKHSKLNISKYHQQPVSTSIVSSNTTGNSVGREAGSPLIFRNDWGSSPARERWSRVIDFLRIHSTRRPVMSIPRLSRLHPITSHEREFNSNDNSMYDYASTSVISSSVHKPSTPVDNFDDVSIKAIDTIPTAASMLLDQADIDNDADGINSFNALLPAEMTSIQAALQACSLFVTGENVSISPTRVISCIKRRKLRAKQRVYAFQALKDILEIDINNSDPFSSFNVILYIQLALTPSPSSQTDFSKSEKNVHLKDTSRKKFHYLTNLEACDVESLSQVQEAFMGFYTALVNLAANYVNMWVSSTVNGSLENENNEKDHHLINKYNTVSYDVSTAASGHNLFGHVYLDTISLIFSMWHMNFSNRDYKFLLHCGLLPILFKLISLATYEKATERWSKIASDLVSSHCSKRFREESNISLLKPLQNSSLVLSDLKSGVKGYRNIIVNVIESYKQGTLTDQLIDKLNLVMKVVAQAVTTPVLLFRSTSDALLVNEILTNHVNEQILEFKLIQERKTAEMEEFQAKKDKEMKKRMLLCGAIADSSHSVFEFSNDNLSLAMRNERSSIVCCAVGSIEYDLDKDPASLYGNYFEVEIVDAGPRDIGIGLADMAHFPLTGQMPGWDQYSYGYHGDDGAKFGKNKTPGTWPLFSDGDIIGCGFLMDSKNIFYTRNGSLLGVAFTSIPERKLKPVLGFTDRHNTVQKVSVNFGLQPFMYNGSEIVVNPKALAERLLLKKEEEDKLALSTTDSSDQKIQPLIHPSITTSNSSDFATLNSSTNTDEKLPMFDLDLLRAQKRHIAELKSSLQSTELFLAEYFNLRSLSFSLLRHLLLVIDEYSLSEEHNQSIYQDTNGNTVDDAQSASFDRSLIPANATAALKRGVSTFGTLKSITIEDSKLLREEIIAMMIQELLIASKYISTIPNICSDPSSVIAYSQLFQSNVLVTPFVGSFLMSAVQFDETMSSSKFESSESRGLLEKSEVESIVFSHLRVLCTLVPQNSALMEEVSSVRTIHALFTLLKAGSHRTQQQVLHLLKLVLPQMFPEDVESAIVSDWYKSGINCPSGVGTDVNPAADPSNASHNKRVRRMPDTIMQILLEKIRYSLSSLPSEQSGVNSVNKRGFGYGDFILQSADDYIRLVQQLVGNPTWTEIVAVNITEAFGNAADIMRTFHATYTHVDGNEEINTAVTDGECIKPNDLRIIEYATAAAACLSGLNLVRVGSRVSIDKGSTNYIVVSINFLENTANLIEDNENFSKPINVFLIVNEGSGDHKDSVKSTLNKASNIAGYLSDVSLQLLSPVELSITLDFSLLSQPMIPNLLDLYRLILSWLSFVSIRRNHLSKLLNSTFAVLSRASYIISTAVSALVRNHADMTIDAIHDSNIMKHILELSLHSSFLPSNVDSSQLAKLWNFKQARCLEYNNALESSALKCVGDDTNYLPVSSDLGLKSPQKVGDQTAFLINDSIYQDKLVMISKELSLEYNVDFKICLRHLIFYMADVDATRESLKSFENSKSLSSSDEFSQKDSVSANSTSNKMDEVFAHHLHDSNILMNIDKPLLTSELKSLSANALNSELKPTSMSIYLDKIENYLDAADSNDLLVVVIETIGLVDTLNSKIYNFVRLCDNPLNALVSSYDGELGNIVYETIKVKSLRVLQSIYGDSISWSLQTSAKLDLSLSLKKIRFISSKLLMNGHISASTEGSNVDNLLRLVKLNLFESQQQLTECSASNASNVTSILMKSLHSPKGSTPVTKTNNLLKSLSSMNYNLRSTSISSDNKHERFSLSQFLVTDLKQNLTKLLYSIPQDALSNGSGAQLFEEDDIREFSIGSPHPFPSPCHSVGTLDIPKSWKGVSVEFDSRLDLASALSSLKLFKIVQGKCLSVWSYTGGDKIIDKLSINIMDADKLKFEFMSKVGGEKRPLILHHIGSSRPIESEMNGDYNASSTEVSSLNNWTINESNGTVQYTAKLSNSPVAFGDDDTLFSLFEEIPLEPLDSSVSELLILDISRDDVVTASLGNHIGITSGAWYYEIGVKCSPTCPNSDTFSLNLDSLRLGYVQIALQNDLSDKRDNRGLTLISNYLSRGYKIGSFSSSNARLEIAVTGNGNVYMNGHLELETMDCLNFDEAATLGCLLDINDVQISVWFCINGHWSSIPVKATLTKVEDNADYVLIPAINLSHNFVLTYNFGDKPFKYSPSEVVTSLLHEGHWQGLHCRPNRLNGQSICDLPESEGSHSKNSTVCTNTGWGYEMMIKPLDKLKFLVCRKFTCVFKPDLEDGKIKPEEAVWIWRPLISVGNNNSVYGSLGDIITFNSQCPLGALLIGVSACLPPIKFEMVCTSQDIGFTVWRPIPPKGYVALGDVVMNKSSTSNEPPSGACVCVPLYAVEKCQLGKKLYTSRRGYATTSKNYDFSLWSTNNDLGLFFGSPCDQSALYGEKSRPEGVKVDGTGLGYRLKRFAVGNSITGEWHSEVNIDCMCPSLSWSVLLLQFLLNDNESIPVIVNEIFPLILDYFRSDLSPEPSVFVPSVIKIIRYAFKNFLGFQMDKLLGLCRQVLQHALSAISTKKGYNKLPERLLLLLDIVIEFENSSLELERNLLKKRLIGDLGNSISPPDSGDSVLKLVDNNSVDAGADIESNKEEMKPEDKLGYIIARNYLESTLKSFQSPFDFTLTENSSCKWWLRQLLLTSTERSAIQLEADSGLEKFIAAAPSTSSILERMETVKSDLQSVLTFLHNLESRSKVTNKKNLNANCKFTFDDKGIFEQVDSMNLTLTKIWLQYFSNSVLIESNHPYNLASSENSQLKESIFTRIVYFPGAEKLKFTFDRRCSLSLGTSLVLVPSVGSPVELKKGNNWHEKNISFNCDAVKIIFIVGDNQLVKDDSDTKGMDTENLDKSSITEKSEDNEKLNVPDKDKNDSKEDLNDDVQDYTDKEATYLWGFAASIHASGPIYESVSEFIDLDLAFSTMSPVNIKDNIDGTSQLSDFVMNSSYDNNRPPSRCEPRLHDNVSAAVNTPVDIPMTNDALSTYIKVDTNTANKSVLGLSVSDNNDSSNCSLFSPFFTKQDLSGSLSVPFAQEVNVSIDFVGFDSNIEFEDVEVVISYLEGNVEKSNTFALSSGKLSETVKGCIGSSIDYSIRIKPKQLKELVIVKLEASTPSTFATERSSTDEPEVKDSEWNVSSSVTENEPIPKSNLENEPQTASEIARRTDLNNSLIAMMEAIEVLELRSHSSNAESPMTTEDMTTADINMANCIGELNDLPMPEAVVAEDGDASDSVVINNNLTDHSDFTNIDNIVLLESDASVSNFTETGLDGWCCSICTVFNLNSTEICVACDAPREASTGGTGDAAATTVTTNSTLGWWCSECTFINVLASTRCSMCENERGGDVIGTAHSRVENENDDHSDRYSNPSGDDNQNDSDEDSDDNDMSDSDLEINSVITEHIQLSDAKSVRFDDSKLDFNTSSKKSPFVFADDAYSSSIVSTHPQTLVGKRGVLIKVTGKLNDLSKFKTRFEGLLALERLASNSFEFIKRDSIAESEVGVETLADCTDGMAVDAINSTDEFLPDTKVDIKFAASTNEDSAKDLKTKSTNSPAVKISTILPADLIYITKHWTVEADTALLEYINVITMTSNSSVAKSFFSKIENVTVPLNYLDYHYESTLSHYNLLQIQCRICTLKLFNDIMEDIIQLANLSNIPSPASSNVTNFNPIRNISSSLESSFDVIPLGPGVSMNATTVSLPVTTSNTLTTSDVFETSSMNLDSDESFSLGYLLRKYSSYLFLNLKQPILDQTIKSMTIKAGSACNLTLDNSKALESRDMNHVDILTSQNCFVQAFNQLASKDASVYRYVYSGDRVFQITFKGEDGIDAGGVFREGMSRIVEDLFSSSFNLLILCPNGQHAININTEKYLPNPSQKSSTALKMFQFIGRIMAMSIRVKLFLPFEFPSFIWKRVIGEECNSLEDLMTFDSVACSYIKQLTESTLDEDSFNFKYKRLKFNYTSSDGTEKALKKEYENVFVTFENRFEYCDAVLHARLHEFDEQIEMISTGINDVIPLNVLRLFSWQQLESLVAGSPTFDIPLWKSKTDASGVPSKTLELFWKVIESLTPKEQAGFVRFAWGRSRLPSEKEFTTKMRLTSAGSSPLPIAHTCFFSIELPDYPDEKSMRHGILAAIHFGLGGILLG